MAYTHRQNSDSPPLSGEDKEYVAILQIATPNKPVDLRRYHSENGAEANGFHLEIARNAASYSFTPKLTIKTKAHHAWERKPSIPFAARNENQKIWKRYELLGVEPQKLTEIRQRKSPEASKRYVKKMKMMGEECGHGFGTKWDEGDDGDQRHKRVLGISQNRSPRKVIFEIYEAPNEPELAVEDDTEGVEDEGAQPHESFDGTLEVDMGTSESDEDGQKEVIENECLTTSLSEQGEEVISEDDLKDQDTAITEEVEIPIIAEMPQVVDGPKEETIDDQVGQAAMSMELDETSTKGETCTNEFEQQEAGDESTKSESEPIEEGGEKDTLDDIQEELANVGTTQINEVAQVLKVEAAEIISDVVSNCNEAIENAIMAEPCFQDSKEEAMHIEEATEMVKQELVESVTEAVYGGLEVVTTTETTDKCDPPPEETTLIPTKEIAVSAPDDDTALLQSFLSRAKARKAAALTTSGPERDTTSQATGVSASPMTRSRTALDSSSVDATTSSIKQSPKASKIPTKLPVESPVRRSKRTPARKAQAAENAIATNNSIPVLRRPNGSEFVFLARTEAQEIALATKTNTRRNKGQAVEPKLRIKEFKEAAEKGIVLKSPSPKKRKASSKENAGRKQAKQVAWDENLARFEREKEKENEDPQDLGETGETKKRNQTKASKEKSVKVDKKSTAKNTTGAKEVPTTRRAKRLTNGTPVSRKILADPMDSVSVMPSVTPIKSKLPVTRTVSTRRRPATKA